MCLSFTIAAGSHQRRRSQVQVSRDSTVFYSLRFETTPTWRATSPYLYPPRTGWSSFTPRHWVSFSSLPTTREASTRLHSPLFRFSRYSYCTERQITQLPTVPLLVRELGADLIENMGLRVVTVLFPSNGYLWFRILAFNRYVTIYTFSLL
jgi:hypothetical protein